MEIFEFPQGARNNVTNDDYIFSCVCIGLCVQPHREMVHSLSLTYTAIENFLKCDSSGVFLCLLIGVFFRMERFQLFFCNLMAFNYLYDVYLCNVDSYVDGES